MACTPLMPFSPTNRVVHPHQCRSSNDKQQHKGALPDADHIVEHAKCQGQEKATQTANNANNTADHTDVSGIINGNMFEHRSLTQGHKKPEDKDEHHKDGQVQCETEFDGAIHTYHAIFGRWVTEEKTAYQRSN